MRTVILLAAGRSRRFVGGNKLLARHSGEPLVRHALRSALRLPAGRIIVVVGHDRSRVAKLVRHSRVRVVAASKHREGLSESLRAGLSALWPVERTIFVLLGDVPEVDAGVAHRLVRRLSPAIDAVRPIGRAGPGHPVLLRRPDAVTVARLQGDRGLGPLVAGRSGHVRVAGRRTTDVDTRRDLARWRVRRG